MWMGGPLKRVLEIVQNDNAIWQLFGQKNPGFLAGREVFVVYSLSVSKESSCPVGRICLTSVLEIHNLS